MIEVESVEGIGGSLSESADPLAESIVLRQRPALFGQGLALRLDR